MKELTIKQKAQRYDETIEQARSLIEFCSDNELKTLEYVFPELKGSAESENEEIRKRLIGYFSDFHLQSFAGLDPKKIITWLEKQGEQKFTVIIPKFRVGDEIKTSNEKSLTITKIDEKGYWSEDLFICSFEDSAKWEVFGKLVDKGEPKFKVGDWVIDNNIKTPFLITDTSEGKYDVVSIYGNDFVFSFNEVERFYHLWTIQDAKDGDMLVASDGSIFLFAGIVGCACKHYVALTADNAIKFNERFEHYWETSRAVHPATKEQRDLLFQKMHDAYYEWDAEKKELKKIVDEEQIKKNLQDNSFRRMFEQKSAWNEEDEKILNEMYEFFDKHKIPSLKHDMDDYAKFIKSLKARVDYEMNCTTTKEWSEEDEDILKICLYFFNGGKGGISDNRRDSILNWLKSLKNRVQPQNTWKPSEEQVNALTHLFDGHLVGAKLIPKDYDNLRLLLEQLKKLRE